MDLFDNGYLEDFLLFVQNFTMTLAASGTMETGAKIKYLCTLVRGEELRQFDSLSSDVQGANPLTLETIVLGLDSYFFPVDFLSKKKRAMRRVMRKPCGLKVGIYADRLIDIN